MVGAHTDSPNLKLKPNPVLKEHGVVKFGVEPYGGLLLNPWFDRDLSLAGRVSYLDSKDIRSSEKHIFKAYNLFVNVHNNHSLANLFNKMAKLYFLKKDYSKSEIYVLKSLKILENLVDNQIKISDLSILTKLKFYKHEAIAADSLIDSVFTLIDNDNKAKVNLKIKEESRRLSLFNKTEELNKTQRKLSHTNIKLKRVKLFIFLSVTLFLIIIFFIFISIKRLNLSRNLFNELKTKTALLEAKEALNEKYSEEKIHLETKNIILKMVFDANEDFNQPLDEIVNNLTKIKSSEFCPSEKLKKRLYKIEISINRIKNILNEMSRLKNVETEKYLDSHAEKMISFKNKDKTNKH
jgi:hypothetical protein